MKYLIILVLYSSSSLAQMASPSIFPTMKSVNPSILGSRGQSQFTTIASRDDIEKKYDLSTLGSGETEMTINNMSLYYGGKGGNFLTFEGNYIISGGSRKISVDLNNYPSRSTSNDLEYSLLEGSIGIGEYFGLSYAKLDYENTTAYQFVFGSTTYNTGYITNVDGDILKGGMTLPFKNFNLSAFYQITNTNLKNVVTNESFGGPGGNGSDKNTVTGAAIGYKSKIIHLEFGYELSSLKSNFTPDEITALDKVTNTTAESKRISATAEISLGKLLLGLTIRKYIDGFQDPEKLVFNELVYTDANTTSRTEQIINFGWGQTKGLTIGGSISISKVDSEESFPLFTNENGSPTTDKYDTKTKQQSILINLGYTW